MPNNAKNSKFMDPQKLSPDLEAVVGKGPMARTEVTKKIWEYIKKHKLQDPNNKRNIVPDKLLEALFGTKEDVSMFQMTKLVNKHIG